MSDFRRELNQDNIKDIWVKLPIESGKIERPQYSWGREEEISVKTIQDLNFKARNRLNIELTDEIERVKTIVTSYEEIEFNDEIWKKAIFLLRNIAHFLWNIENKITIDDLPSITVESGDVDVNWDTNLFELIFSITTKNKEIVDIYGKDLNTHEKIPLEYIGPHEVAEEIITKWLKKIL